MKSLILIGAFLAGLLTIAQGQIFNPKIPNCSDEETLDLVKEIAVDSLGGIDQMRFLVGAEGRLEVKHIRTTGQNSNFSALVTRYECAAELKLITSSKRIVEYPIEYTVEQTDDGNYYVSVYGL
jgi:hypothetical protein